MWPQMKDPEEPSYKDKIMGGYIFVRFGPGLEVLTFRSADVTTPTVVIGGLPKDTSKQEALAIAREFKPDLPLQAVRSVVRGDRLKLVVYYDDVLVADAAIKAVDGRVWKNVRLAAGGLKPTSTSNDVTKIEFSWFQPSKAAYLRFTQRDALYAAIAAAEGTTEIRGQRYKCLPQAPNLRQVLPYSVLLVGLKVETTEDDLRGIFTCDALKMKEPKYNVSSDDVIEYVRSLFDGTKITGWKVISRPEDVNQKVQFDVESADSARKFFRENDGKKHGFLGNMALGIDLSYSVTFRTSIDIFGAIKEEVATLELAERKRELELDSADKMKGDNSPARIQVCDRYSPIRVRILGRGRAAVVRIKTVMQKLLRGETIYGEDKRALWDPALKEVNGRKVIDEVKHRTGVHIRCDARSRSVTIYGTQERRQAARTILVEQYRLLLDQQHEILLVGQMLRRLHRGGLAAVQKHLGVDKVIPDIPNRRLTVRCSSAEVETVKLLLHRAGTNHLEEETTAGEDTCTVCLSPAEQPTIAPCGHIYCELCVSEYVGSTVNTSNYPIVCFGNGGNCNTPFPLAFIRSFLSDADMDRHFTQSFSSYIQTHPKEYRFCPTPDCETVYGVTTTSKIFTCPQCLIGICTTCCTESHDSQSCDEFQRTITTELHEKLFHRWCNENEVKNCPTCKSNVEKDTGCHHMTCKCGQHFCWLCLQTFPDGGQEIYNHLETNECRTRQGQRDVMEEERARARREQIFDLQHTLEGGIARAERDFRGVVERAQEQREAEGRTGRGDGDVCAIM